MITNVPCAPTGIQTTSAFLRAGIDDGKVLLLHFSLNIVVMSTDIRFVLFHVATWSAVVAVV